MDEPRRVLVLGLGGTIAMSDAPGGGARPSLHVTELLTHLSGEVDVAAEDVKLVPGAALDIGDVLQVAERIRRARTEGYAGVVVVQGTDTIEDVAYALHLLVGPMLVVVTGAMRHASTPGADGAANLAAAVAVAASKSCAGLGVLVVLGDEIHSAGLVRKTSTSMPHAFTSWPGPLGQVSEGRARVSLRPTDSPRALEISRDAAVPRVELLTAVLGACPQVLVTPAAALPAGVVVAGFGGGHVPPSWVESLTTIAAACPVVLCSRTGTGAVLQETYGFPGSERDLLGRGLLWGGSHPPIRACVALTLLVMAGADRAAIAAHFAV